MTNEIIFLATALIDLTFILLIFRYGAPGLTGLLVANIILVSTLGSKIISIFGFVTNAGNVFYAGVFFAGIMLAEHYGAKAAFKSVWIGFVALMMFVLMGQLTVRSGTHLSAVDQAMDTLFNAVPRIALGSVVAYLASQNLNIYIFSSLKKKTAGKLLSFRVAVSSLIGQFVDSILFFIIAFWAVLPLNELIQSILTGFMVKFSIGILSILFIKMSYLIKPLEKINYKKRVA